MLITPTNFCLGWLDLGRIAQVDLQGRHVSGDQPSKEAFLHLAMYKRRPQEQSVVHLHSTWSVAVSCLREIDPSDCLPPITAYYVLRVGRLPSVKYYPPGDEMLAKAVRQQATAAHSVLLANHGPVVAGKSLESAPERHRRTRRNR